MVRTLLTAREVADTLRVSTMTVYRMVRVGELRALRVGRQMRIPQPEVVAFMERNTTPGIDRTSGNVVARHAALTSNPAESA